MRTTAFFSLLTLTLAFVGCQTRAFSLGDDAGTPGIPSERRGLDYVDIDNDWRLESAALTVTRDQSQHQVLRAAAQMGAKLTSLRLPHHTHVPTTATADAIYYDAFQDRFEFVGDPVIAQGAKVTQRSGPNERLMMYSDGTLRFEEVPSLVPTS